MLADDARKQRSIIRDLLRHAREDKMSSVDLTICHRALVLIEGDITAEGVRSLEARLRPTVCVIRG